MLAELKQQFLSLTDFSDPLKRSAFFNGEESKVLRRASVKDMYTIIQNRFPDFAIPMHIGGAAYDYFMNGYAQRALEIMELAKEDDKKLPQTAVTQAVGFLLYVDKFSFTKVKPFLEFLNTQHVIDRKHTQKKTITKDFRRFIQKTTDQRGYVPIQ